MSIHPISMLFTITTKALAFLNKNKLLLKRILLCLAPFFLKFNKDPFKSMSFESLSSHFVFNPSNEFQKESQPYDSKPSNQTIFIKLDGSEEFELRVRDRISRLKVRSKSIIISRNNSNDHYFIKIYLKENSKNSYNVYPLINYQPNSEIAFLTRSLFPSKLMFSFRDLFYKPFENSIELHLENNYSSIIKLCTLIRYFSNIYSHYYGIYYYIPLSHDLIRAESLAKFIFITLAILLFNLNTKFNTLFVFSISFLYLMAPFTCIFFIKSRIKAVFLITFSVLNLKFGFLFALFCYFIEISIEAKMILKKVRSSRI